MKFEIHTERLTLRPLLSSDRDGWVRLHERSEAHLGPWSPAQTGTWDEMFTDILEKSTSSEAHVKCVGVLEDGECAGLFNLNQIVRGVFQNAYASWLLGEEHTGRGYATEGVGALLDLAFSGDVGLGLHRVQANIIPTNERSVRLAERVGMRLEGRAERYLEIAGAWRDHLMYAKTVEEHQLRYLS